MTILVTVASKHRRTLGIAEAVAAELRTMGYEVDVAPANGSVRVDRYDAVILGSAVYMGKWLPEATEFAARNMRALREKLVWLFSSGPLGRDDPVPTDDPAGVADLLAEIGARGHQVFVGKLDKQDLGFVERLATRAVKAPEGDFRDWSAIRAWAREIGTSLGPRPANTASGEMSEGRA
jgi:menaquinone-dependent protoporphyrinogen oxidase